ncbi:leucine-rich repeat protein [Treponema putidum]|uniref:leucine-rich repeat protein n=1 Tax=Treponema putidum TaxID=221027 RepID=UPI003D8D9EB1
MKKALMKTSVKILVLGLALTAMLFGCKQPSGSSNSAGSGGGNGSDESGKYSITYHLDGGTNNVDNPASYTKNDEFPLRAPSKEGQVFDGWFGNSKFSGEAVTKIAKGTTGKKEFWAKWVAESESAAYTVKHLEQNADDDGYTQKETEQPKGGKGSKTLAVAKQYEGFTAQPFEQKTINEDGSTVVEIKYDRKIITLTLDLDGGTISPAIPGNKIIGKFGAPVTPPAAPSKDGNRFSGWVPEIPAEFSKDSTHTAQWTINITVNVGDERIESYTDPALSNKKPGVKWSDIKPSDETIKLKPEWQGGDYGLYEWRLNDENGQKIDDDYTFTKDTTVYAVTNYLKFKTETENGELCISEDKGYTGDKPKGKIIIPDGIKHIGKNAFKDCGELTSVSMPEGITEIAYCAFQDCSSLKSISLPASLTRIEYYAFEGCSSLTSISLPASLTKIEFNAFEGCSSLESISLPEGITEIEGYAFGGCSRLKSILLPAGITKIAKYAFKGCSSLTSISLPEGITKINSSTFEGCSSLTSISLPEGITEIENSAFEGCSSLTSISLPEGITKINSGTFEGCSSLTSISLPEGITEIENSAFEGCSSLTSISLPEGITMIAGSAFWGCSSLTSISLPEGITMIAGYAFGGCSSLTSISLPEGITMIAGSAFNDCSGLNSVIFADKKGWAVYNWSDDINKIADISETDLEAPATAATLLKTTYSDKKWKKN